jgi:hypothetical protein
MINRAASLGSRDAAALRQREPAIFDRGDNGMSSVERGTDLAGVIFA